MEDGSDRLRSSFDWERDPRVLPGEPRIAVYAMQRDVVAIRQEGPLAMDAFVFVRRENVPALTAALESAAKPARGA